jgi:hypothetical protein
VELLACDRAVFVLSLDIALDADVGDLTCRCNVDRWLSLVATGRVIAIVAGPPCESWSSARHAPVAGRRSSTVPRPIRSTVEPWGITGVSHRERLQLSLANALLQTSITFAAAAARYGASMILEHPRTPTWRCDTPSIWRLPEVRRLLDLDCARLIHVDQCTAGAPSRKPTSLLVINLPSLDAEIARLPGRGVCCHPHGHPASLGLASLPDGRTRFRTAPLKEYPPRLCQAFATSILTDWHWALNEWAPELDLPADFAPFFQPLDPYCQFELGADHMPRSRLD